MEPGFWEHGGGLRAKETREWRAEETGSSSDKTVTATATVKAKTYRQSDYMFPRGSPITGFSMYQPKQQNNRTTQNMPYPRALS